MVHSTHEAGVYHADRNHPKNLPTIAANNPVDNAIAKAERRVLQRHYVPQPPDFPISCAEPGYLKTVWLRVQ